MPEAFYKSDPVDSPLSEAHLSVLPPRQAITITAAPQVYQCPVPHCPHLIHLPDDGVIIAWLQEKTGKSHTWKTHAAYHSAILSLRTILQANGYDLLMDLSADATFAGYILLLQHWLETRSASSHHQGPISDRTSGG